MAPTTEPASDAVATTIEDNLCAYAAFFGATAAAETNSQPGFLWVISRIPTLPFTGILRPYPSAPTLAETIAATMSLFHQRQARPSWIFNPSRSSPELVAQLNRYQLKATANLPGMALDLSTLGPPPAPLRVTSVADPAMLATWVGIYAASNGAPDWIATELAALYAARDYAAGAPLRLYLGWHNERPVATAATFRVAGVVGLYEVATLPELRRQRIASRMTYWALDDARQDGCTLATLVSSTMAERLYRGMGFVEYCRLVIYN